MGIETLKRLTAETNPRPVCRGRWFPADSRVMALVAFRSRGPFQDHKKFRRDPRLMRFHALSGGAVLNFDRVNSSRNPDCV